MTEYNVNRQIDAGSLRADVLIVTVTETESKTVTELFAQETHNQFQRYFIDNTTYHDLGIVGNARVFMIQTGMGSGGPDGSLLTVQEAISKLSPSAVVMVGIAFGVNEAKQRIGDVLVSSQLWLYDLKRVGTDPQGEMQIIPRGERAAASPRLLDRFRSGKMDWEGPKIRFGLLLSGDSLIDNIDFRDQLLKFEPEAIGGEMEAEGLYSAAQRANTNWIVVKAICDWADGTKGKNKKRRQQKAAANAVRFVIHVLSQGGFAPQFANPNASKALTSQPQPQLAFSRETLELQRRPQPHQTATVESPILIGLVIDLSRSMLRTLSNTKGLQKQDIQDVLQLLIEKVTAYCQTPEAPEILPQFALFAFGYGLGNLRQGINDTANKLLSVKKPSQIIPTGEIRDLLEEVAVKRGLSFTPSISILNDYWDDYRISLKSQFVDVGLGRSRFYESLCRVHERLHKELGGTSYTKPIVLFVSDGQIDDAPYEDAERVTQEIQHLGVNIVHCYVGPQDITMPKAFYATPEARWPEGASSLFGLSSSIDTANSFLINVAREAQSRGWLVPENARLFVQVNHSKMLEELMDILLEAMRD